MPPMVTAAHFHFGARRLRQDVTGQNILDLAYRCVLGSFADSRAGRTDMKSTEVQNIPLHVSS